jgi:carbonic anhydrase/acetyltransferase-like protein (isoleucine patch superfamily)
MSIIRSVQGKAPEFGKDCFISENAVITGDVIAGNNCSFWFHSVVRGDLNSIRIGNYVNIQDGAVLHTRNKKSKIVIGDNVTIAHNAVIHGAKTGNNVLIGIGAIVLDNAEIGNNCIIGAGSVIAAGTKLESYSLYMGNPAEKIRDVTDEEIQERIIDTAKKYAGYGKLYNGNNGEQL